MAGSERQVTNTRVLHIGPPTARSTRLLERSGSQPAGLDAAAECCLLMFLEHRDRLEAEWIMRVSLRRAELVHRSILGASSTKTASKPAGNGLAGAPVEAISRSAVIGSGSQQLGGHRGGYWRCCN